MGFLKQDTPQIDFEEWSKGTRAEKIIPMARHWAEVGFGTPVLLHLFYVVKIALYVLGAWLLALTTTGINGFTNVAHWYAEPIVFEKVVLYTMLFEVVGLGCGFGPLNNRFFPPLVRFCTGCGPALSAATVPGRIPFTKGITERRSTRCCTARCWCSSHRGLLRRRRTGSRAGHDVGVLPAWQIWAVLVSWRCWPARQGHLPGRSRRGVRSFRSRSCSPVTHGHDPGRQTGMPGHLLGAAASKLNKHFPFVISTMMSNNPVFRPRFINASFSNISG